MGIVEIIKKLIEVKDNDLSFLNVGDIIWAKRYKNDEEKEKIKKGHQESPYVIIKKTRGEVYALQCTSNPHQEIKWKMVYYPLGRLNYNMRKSTYINCLVVHKLKEIQFVEVIGQLCEYDLNQLKKQLYIIINSSLKDKPNIEKKYLDFEVGVGDIILYKDTKYYINDIHNTNYEVYRLRKNIKKNKNILINNTFYSFVFEKPETIKIKTKYDLVDTFNSGEIEIINRYKKAYMDEYNDKRNTRNSLKTGVLIDYNAGMYYIYGENKKMYLVYAVYSNTICQKGMADIQIKGGIYKTFFNTLELSKYNLNLNGYKIRRCANDEEIKYNSRIFSLPKKSREKKRKKLAKAKGHMSVAEMGIDDFVPMVILKNKINKEFYLIISREENVIELVNINDMSDYYYFELERDICSFEYYRILSKEEFNTYVNKIQDYKDVVATFER